jgi:hypothetical protein
MISMQVTMELMTMTMTMTMMTRLSWIWSSSQGLLASRTTANVPT